MRNLYSKKTIFSSVTQGSILNNCIANEYTNMDSYGMVITPRCDMAHGIKVSTVHYLPLVKLEDWMQIDFIAILEDRLKKALIGDINQWIKENYNIEDFLSSSLATQENIKDLFDNPSPNEKIKNKFKQYFNEDGAFATAVKNEKKLKKQILRELHSGTLHNFYLVENWIQNTESKYFVIILREVHQVSREIIKKYIRGFLAEEFDKEHLQLNSLRVNDTAYKLQAEIASPFVEHILQSFVYNFSRIGVEDMEKPNWDTLI